MSLPAEESLDKGSPVPLYHQLEQRVIADLRAGVFRPGDPFYTEQELGERYGVSRITVRQAVERLLAEGFLYRPRARGRLHVSPLRLEQRLARLEGFFTDDLLAQGMTPSTRVVRATVTADPAVAPLLGVRPDAPLHLVERLHQADDMPVAFQRSFIPFALVPTLAEGDLSGSLLRLVERKARCRFTRARQRLRVRRATQRERELLQLGRPGWALSMERLSFDERDRPVEYFEAVLQLERYDLVMEVRRGEAGDRGMPRPERWWE